MNSDVLTEQQEARRVAIVAAGKAIGYTDPNAVITLAQWIIGNDTWKPDVSSWGSAPTSSDTYEWVDLSVTPEQAANVEAAEVDAGDADDRDIFDDGGQATPKGALSMALPNGQGMRTVVGRIEGWGDGWFLFHEAR